MEKNNVIRLLESRKVQYSAYELSSEKRSAVETAKLLQVPPESVYKSIVLTRQKPGKLLLCMIPGPNEVDLKKVAAFVGDKKVTLPTQNEAEQLTGLQAGGISPLALLNRGFVFILDIKALLLENVHISGGQRNLNIRLSVHDIISLTGARTADISIIEV
jgi:Cys-tRNA(Pro)/Cys-tRNA(Cys) deacylase